MTITLTREEAQQVLDAFVNWDARGRLRLIETLRARLSAPELEPVAWLVRDYVDGLSYPCAFKDPAGSIKGESVPLYLHPPQREEGCAECGKKSSDGWALYCVKCSEREWQGLTKKQLLQIWGEPKNFNDPMRFARAIEAKLKEKNT